MWTRGIWSGTPESMLDLIRSWLIHRVSVLAVGQARDWAKMKVVLLRRLLVFRSGGAH